MKAIYSLVHLTNPYCTPPELIYAAAEAGYDCVGLRGIPTRVSQCLTETEQKGESSVSQAITGNMPFDFVNDHELFWETHKAVKRTGVPVHDSENARIFDGVDVANYEEDLALTSELGVKHILTNIWTDDKDFYIKQFIKLCKIASKYDITVNLEFVTWASIRNIRECRELLEASHCNNIGIVLDTLHYYRSRVSLDDVRSLPREWFSYLHLSDCEAKIPEERDKLIATGINGRLLPGEGAVDIRSIVNALPDVIRGIEVPNEERMHELGFEKYIKKALVTTKEYLGDM